MSRAQLRNALLLVMTPLVLLSACATVKVEAPEKPIEINMNVNIKHEILIKVEKDIDKLLEDKKGLF